MAYNYFIQPLLPADTNEKPSLGASRIRALKNALIERLTSWVYGFDSDGTESAVGLKSAPLVTGVAPTEVANQVLVYAKDVEDVAELHCIDEDGNEIQITSAGVLANVGDYEVKNINEEYLADKNLYVPHPSNSVVVVASDINFTQVVHTGGGAVVKKGYYYKVGSVNSGTYSIIGV